MPLRLATSADRGVIGAEVRRSSDGTVVGYTGPRRLPRAHPAQRHDRDLLRQHHRRRRLRVRTSTSSATRSRSRPPPTCPAATSHGGRPRRRHRLRRPGVRRRRHRAAGRRRPTATRSPPRRTSRLRALTRATRSRPPSRPPSTTDETAGSWCPFDPAGQDGEYTLAFTSPGSTGRRRAGPGDLRRRRRGPRPHPARGHGRRPAAQITYDGTLTVEGLPLPGRDVDLAYTRGTEQAPGTDGRRRHRPAADSGAGGCRRPPTRTAPSPSPSATSSRPAAPPRPAAGCTVTARGLGDTLDATADFTQVVTPTTPTDPPTTTPTPTPTPDARPDPDARTGQDHRRAPAHGLGRRTRVRHAPRRGPDIGGRPEGADPRP